MTLRHQLFPQCQAEKSDRDEAEGHVHGEDPAPAERVGEKPAHRRPRNSGCTPHGTGQPLQAGPLLDREEIAEDRQRHREYATCSESLERAEENELGHRLCQSTEQ
ncbi:hypothetical protein HRbin27_01499 [bacterium HR27]|nr:hypothetical protein HRbin27_01499 [bacterium HR27]